VVCKLWLSVGFVLQVAGMLQVSGIQVAVEVVVESVQKAEQQ